MRKPRKRKKRKENRHRTGIEGREIKRLEGFHFEKQVKVFFLITAPYFAVLFLF